MTNVIQAGKIGELDDGWNFEYDHNFFFRFKKVFLLFLYIDKKGLSIWVIKGWFNILMGIVSFWLQII